MLNAFWDFWRKASGIVIGAVLFLLGVSLWVNYPGGLPKDFGTALVIAGILSITVDPVLKRRMQAEAAFDIFHHMLGFKLPLPIQEKLKKIVEDMVWYRENMSLHYNLSICEAKSVVICDVELEYEVVNATQHVREFCPTFDFEEPEDPKLKRVVCFGEPGYGGELALVADPKEPQARRYSGRPVLIGSGERKQFKYEYEVRYPLSAGLFYQHFKYPTIGLRLTVKAPETLEVTATPAEQQVPGEWKYTDRLFMEGDYIQVRWNARNGQ